MTLSLSRTTVGIDVGATKIAAVAWSGGRLGQIAVEPTASKDAEAVVDQITRLVRARSAAFGTIGGVGLSVAAEIDYDHGVVLGSNLPLAGTSLRATLTERLQIPVFLDNDGNCAAIAEATCFSSPMNRNLVMLTLGTGVGGGAMVNGQLLRGHSGLGAELGHLVVAADGPACFGVCPNRGCLEALCSGTALARDGRETALRFPDGVLAEVLERRRHIQAEDVVAAARAGDHHAQGVLGAFARWLGVGLSSLINIFEPRLIAIGGGLSRASDLFLSGAIDEMASRTTPARRQQVTIQLARSGPHASVVGAALIATHELQ